MGVDKQDPAIAQRDEISFTIPRVPLLRRKLEYSERCGFISKGWTDACQEKQDHI
jgi:hypothetical protein